MKGTPLPWKLIKPEVLEDSSIYPLHITGGIRDLVICRFLGSDIMAETATDIRSQKANAEFIVLACNSYYALVNALQALVDYHEGDFPYESENEEEDDEQDEEFSGRFPEMVQAMKALDLATGDWAGPKGRE